MGGSLKASAVAERPARRLAVERSSTLTSLTKAGLENRDLAMASNHRAPSSRHLARVRIALRRINEAIMVAGEGRAMGIHFAMVFIVACVSPFAGFAHARLIRSDAWVAKWMYVPTVAALVPLLVVLAIRTVIAWRSPAVTRTIARRIQRRERSRYRRPLSAARCAKCGYDLCESPERCPECGLMRPRLPKRAWGLIQIRGKRLKR